MLTVEEIDDFKAKLQTKMLEVAIKQAEAELQHDTECADSYQKDYRFLSLFRTAIFEEEVYTNLDLEKIIPYVIHYGKLSDVVPVSFTGFTNITNNFGGGGIVTIPQVVGLQDILTYLQLQINSIEPKYTRDFVVSLSGGKTLGRFVNGENVPLTGLSLQEGMELIGIEEQFPTYTQPSGVLTSTINGTVEQGVALAPTLTGIFAQNDAGILTGFEVKRNGVVIYDDVTIPITLSTSDAITGVEGILSYIAKFSYNEGIVKNSTPSNTPYPTGKINAGFINSNPVNINVVLPWFYGSSVTNAIPNIYAGTKVIAASNVQLYVPSFGAGIKFLWFAIPRNADGSQRKHFNTWYRAETDKGTIGQPDDLFNAPFIVSVTSVGLAENWIEDYDLYFTDYATEAGTPTTLN